MRIIFWSSFLFLLSVFCVEKLAGQPVSLQEAGMAASNFRKLLPSLTEGDGDSRLLHTEVRMHNNAVAGFLVRFADNGYVFVSGDKRVYPVVCYAPGKDTPNTVEPPAFSAWMEQYFRQIDHAIATLFEPASSTALFWEYLLGREELRDAFIFSKASGPYLISTWNQGLFYNQMCPEDPAGPGGRCYAGCVATAMGQICYYFRFPYTGQGSYSYEHPVYGLISADFENTAYRWNEMENNLVQPNLAVAELLFHLGVSVDMDYGPNGSGMWNHKAAYSLRTHFRFSPKTQYVFRDSTAMNWDSLLYVHLDEKIPLYYAGWSVPNVNGHAFVCDGYQDNFFHFNWGWGGSYDGYFLLDELSPGGSNFNLAQELIINCLPDTNLNVYPRQCSGDDTLVSLRGTVEDGSGPLFNYLPEQNCSWLISPQTTEDSVSHIKIEFHHFDIEDNKDFVTVYNGPTPNSPLIGAYTGNTVPSEIITDGNEALVTFTSDGSHEFSGWFLSYQSVTPVWCNGLTTLTEPSGLFSDGSGSFNYQNGSACMWNISPVAATSATLYFTSFNTEEAKDLVKVFDGQTSQLLAEYSGHYSPEEPPLPVTSQSGKLFIAFSSNSTVTAKGWEAYYESTATGTAAYFDYEKPNIFPNPTSGEINIYNFHSQTGITAEFFDNQGRRALTLLHIPSESEGRFRFNAHGLKPGLYVIRITGYNQVVTQKISIVL